jgi:hypothetical protein
MREISQDQGQTKETGFPLRVILTKNTTKNSHKSKKIKRRELKSLRYLALWLLGNRFDFSKIYVYFAL